MEITDLKKRQSNWLLFLGVLLFLLGLFIGLFIPMMTNPRMGLTAHLEGVMNGMFLVILGLISFLLITLALAMIFVCVIILTGPYRNIKRS